MSWVRRGCEAALVAARLNLLWWLGTLAGGVLLGAAPSTVAVYHLARQEHRGIAYRPWREYVTAYRAEFGKANRLLAPVFLAAVALAADSRLAGGLPARDATLIRGVLIVLAVALAAAALHLVPLYVHYDLTVLACLRRTGVVAMRQAPTTALLLLLANCWIQLVAAVPALALLFGVGGWVSLHTWLSLRAYHHLSHEKETYRHAV